MEQMLALFRLSLPFFKKSAIDLKVEVCDFSRSFFTLYHKAAQTLMKRLDVTERGNKSMK